MQSELPSILRESSQRWRGGWVVNKPPQLKSPDTSIMYFRPPGYQHKRSDRVLPRFVFFTGNLTDAVSSHRGLVGSHSTCCWPRLHPQENLDGSLYLMLLKCRQTDRQTGDQGTHFETIAHASGNTSLAGIAYENWKIIPKTCVSQVVTHTVKKFPPNLYHSASRPRVHTV